jgi:hypothetical protein
VYVPRARVAVKGRITPGVRFQIEGDLTEPMHPLKDGYLSLEMIPRHRIRIGQQKTPFGWEQRQSAVRLLVVRRAEVTRALARGPDPRDIGVQVLGDWDLPAGLGLHYAVALVNGAGANVIEDDTPRKNLWGRAGMSWISPGRAVVIAAGGSYANGDRLGEADPGATPLAFVFHRIGADLEIETPYVAGVAEYIFGIDHRTLDTVHAGGYYVLLWGRTPWNAAPIVRYQAYDPDLDAAGERISRFTVGGYYDLLPVRARLLVNYDIDLSIDRRDNGLFVQAQVVF